MPEILYTALKLFLVATVFFACYLVNYKRVQLEEEYKKHMVRADGQAPRRF